MRETILLINFQDKDRLRDIQMMAMAVKVRVKVVKNEEYLKPVGVLAGVKGISTEEKENKEELAELEKEMMIFAGLTETHLNQMLFLMRKSKMTPVDYKAILTETNRSWTVPELYKELEREHEAVTARQKESSDTARYL